MHILCKYIFLKKNLFRPATTTTHHLSTMYIAESNMVRVNYCEKQLSMKYDTNETPLLLDPADDKKKNLILAMTPDGKVVGVKFAWDRPAFFEGDSDRENWLKQAFERVERVCNEIRTGTHTIDSYGDMLDKDPEVTEETLEALRQKTKYG